MFHFVKKWQRINVSLRVKTITYSCTTNLPQTNVKKERGFRTYGENRQKFKSSEAFRKWFDNRIHGELKYNRGETPKNTLTQYVNSGIGLTYFTEGLNEEGVTNNKRINIGTQYLINFLR
jgi:hypothetical protein